MKAKSAKSIDIKTMQVNGKSKKKTIDIKTMQPVEKKQKAKTNFSTENFVNIEDGKPLKKPIVQFSIEAFKGKNGDYAICDLTVGKRNELRDVLVTMMEQSEGYFDLFAESIVLALISRAEQAAKESKKKAKKPTKKAAKKK